MRLEAERQKEKKMSGNFTGYELRKKMWLLNLEVKEQQISCKQSTLRLKSKTPNTIRSFNDKM